jgi:hypothetical protein
MAPSMYHASVTEADGFEDRFLSDNPRPKPHIFESPPKLPPL